MGSRLRRIMKHVAMVQCRSTECTHHLLNSHLIAREPHTSLSAHNVSAQYSEHTEHKHWTPDSILNRKLNFFFLPHRRKAYSKHEKETFFMLRNMKKKIFFLVKSIKYQYIATAHNSGRKGAETWSRHGLFWQFPLVLASSTTCVVVSLSKNARPIIHMKSFWCFLYI